MLPVLLLALTMSQSPPVEGPAGKANRPAVSNGELVNMLDTYAIVRAQEALQLNDEQYARFVTRLKRLQQVRRQNTQTRNRILQELRRLTQAPTPDETALRTQLRALHDQDVAAAEELRRASDAVDEVLDPRQQARFRLFEERMERQKLDLLMRVRNRAASAKPAPRR